MSTSLATKNDLRSLLSGDAFRQQVALALPSHLKPERFIRVAITALTRTPKLMECEQASFFKCLLDLSALGIEPDGRRAHLIPYRNNRRNVTECQLIIDYKGLIELAKRSGDVKSWRAETVCEKDEFTWQNGQTNHVINWREARGAVQAVYSAVTLPDGTLDHEVMTREEVDSVRARSRSANDGPWVTDWSEMAKKTVMRRHSKRLTLSPEFHDALIAEEGDAELKQAVGREIPAARVPSIPFLPAPAVEQTPADDDTDHIPFDDPPVAAAPAAPPAPPPAKKRVQKPPQDAPPLVLEQTEERPVEKLRRRIAEDKLDLGRVQEWLDAARKPSPDAMTDPDAQDVLDEYDNMKEAAR